MAKREVLAVHDWLGWVCCVDEVALQLKMGDMKEVVSYVMTEWMLLREENGFNEFEAVKVINWLVFVWEVYLEFEDLPSISIKIGVIVRVHHPSELSECWGHVGVLCQRDPQWNWWWGSLDEYHSIFERENFAGKTDSAYCGGMNYCMIPIWHKWHCSMIFFVWSFGNIGKHVVDAEIWWTIFSPNIFDHRLLLWGIMFTLCFLNLHLLLVCNETKILINTCAAFFGMCWGLGSGRQWWSWSDRGKWGCKHEAWEKLS